VIKGDGRVKRPL
jgi:hypothetical protein